MTITGQVEERGSVPYDEVSREEDPDGFDSDLDETSADHVIRDEDEYSDVTDASDDEDDYNISDNGDTTSLHCTSTPIKGDQLVPSSVHTVTPTSTYRNRTNFSRRQLYHLEMLFRETQYPSHQQVTDLAQTQGIENEKSIKMWFQNRRARFRKMPHLSPVKPPGGNTSAQKPVSTDSSSSTVRQARTFSPIVIQPRASSSDSSDVSTPSPRPSATQQSVPMVGERSLQSLNVSNSSTESCEDNQPRESTRVKNKDEYKAMTLTSLPPDHPFCQLTHGSGTRPKRKVVRDNVIALHEPRAKMARRDPMVSSPPRQKSARRSSSHHGGSRQEAPSPNTLNQLPVGFIPAWPTALPLPTGVIPPSHKNINSSNSSSSGNNSSNNKSNAGSPLDLSKRPLKSETFKQEKKNKDSAASADNINPILPAAGGLPMIPPYFSFPLMSMPGQMNPFMPTGAGATPFMVPMFTGALPSLYGNPTALWAQHAPSKAQQSL